jgi:hypothetical protein
MKRALIFLVMTLAALVVAPVQSAHADLPAGCTYTYHIVSERQGEIIHQVSGKVWWVDIFVQLADTNTAGCTDNIRQATNWNCEWNGNPYNCGAEGHVRLENENGTDLGEVFYDFGSTGPDGVISVYSAWTPRQACHYYTPYITIDQVDMGGVPYTDPDTLFTSGEEYPYCPA